MTSDTSGKSGAPRWRTIAKYVFGAVAVVMLVGAVWSERDGFVAAVARIDLRTLLLSFAFGLAAMFANAMSWRSAYSGMGIDLPIGTSLRVFFVSQIGKYIPGSVWPVLTQMEMAKDHGVARSRAATASLLSMLIGVVSAAIASLALLLSQGAEVFGDYWYVFLVIPIGCVVLLPRVLTWLLTFLGRLIRRPFDVHGIRGRGILGSVGWALLMWVAFGLHAWVLFRDLLSGEQVSLLAAIGAFALAWAAGFLFIIAPAGVGVREAAMVVALGGLMGQADGLAFAILSRVVLTIVDVVVALLGLSLARPRQAQLPSD